MSELVFFTVLSLKDRFPGAVRAQRRRDKLFLRSQDCVWLGACHSPARPDWLLEAWLTCLCPLTVPSSIRRIASLYEPDQRNGHKVATVRLLYYALPWCSPLRMSCMISGCDSQPSYPCTEKAEFKSPASARGPPSNGKFSAALWCQRG